jgi:type I restriction enzyme S subunit
MSREGWRETTLDEIANINPFDHIAKGTIAKKIPMDVLQPFKKKVYDFSFEPYNGGMKFKNGDTIIARITPCLENGKTAYIDILDKDEIAFGSTEYIVLREKNNKSDKQFLYYFACSPDFRDIAILSMTGSSGRQRVQIEIVKDHLFLFPTLSGQKVIASILSSLDDKIDLLHRQNKTLEALAETLFRKWFVEEADEGWEEGTVLDLAIHYKSSINPQLYPANYYYHYSIPAFDSSGNPILELGEMIQSNKYIVPKFCILFSKLNPHRDKRIWLLQDETNENSICSTEFQVILPKDPETLYFMFGWLSYNENYNEISSGVGGTSGSHQRIDPNTIFNFHCPLVDLGYVKEYNKLVRPLMKKRMENQGQICTLIQLRDNLLPKLMSGEMRVK